MSEIIVKDQIPESHKVLLVKSTKAVVAPNEVFSHFDLPIISNEDDGYFASINPAGDELDINLFTTGIVGHNFTVFVDDEGLLNKAEVLDAEGKVVCLAAVFVGLYVLFDIIVDHNKAAFDTPEKQIALSEVLFALIAQEQSIRKVLAQLDTPKLKTILDLDQAAKISLPEDVIYGGTSDPDYLYKVCTGLFFAGNCMFIGNEEYDSEGKCKILPIPDYPLEVAQNLILVGEKIPADYLKAISRY